jgi:NADH-quinone oxidoreductase subunit E
MQKSQIPSEMLLSLLIDLQNQNPKNYLSRDDMEGAARQCGVTKARVYGLVGYYSMLSARPRGRHVIRVCKSPICRLFGSSDIIDHLKDILGIEVGETTHDGIFTLEYSECLGRCNQSPTLMVDDRFYGRLDEVKLRNVIDHFSGGEE